jgi:hypothetical protein
MIFHMKKMNYNYHYFFIAYHVFKKTNQQTMNSTIFEYRWTLANWSLTYRHNRIPICITIR